MGNLGIKHKTQDFICNPVKYIFWSLKKQHTLEGGWTENSGKPTMLESMVEVPNRRVFK